jgi:hypothetical protein
MPSPFLIRISLHIYMYMYTRYDISGNACTCLQNFASHIPNGSNLYSLCLENLHTRLHGVTSQKTVIFTVQVLYCIVINSSVGKRNFQHLLNYLFSPIYSWIRSKLLVYCHKIFLLIFTSTFDYILSYHIGVYTYTCTRWDVVENYVWFVRCTNDIQSAILEDRPPKPNLM